MRLKNFAKKQELILRAECFPCKIRLQRDTQICAYDELICKHGDRPVNQNSRGAARKPSQLHFRSSAGFILEFPLDERSHESMQKRNECGRIFARRAARKIIVLSWTPLITQLYTNGFKTNTSQVREKLKPFCEFVSLRTATDQNVKL